MNQEQQEQQQQQHEEMKRSSSPPPEGEHDDATPIIHEMHRKLLHLLSHPELFHDALDWQRIIEREEEGTSSSSFDGKTSHQGSESNTSDTPYPSQRQLIPPLPHQIFTADVEVVLPQAMTASQLFGIERCTGMELQAAAGIEGVSLLFLRWLALMPEGDHQNIIDPPGLTVMRITGGRYRVTATHRVVWRWMNKFSPASVFREEQDVSATEKDVAAAAAGNATSVVEDEEDTDFDFGDLVTMTIVDVFETDCDGKLLSYCPTFDNRAVHKTQEVTERIKKSASHLKERVDVVVNSPTGQKYIRAASHFGKRRLKSAIIVGNIVKHKIEEEIHKRQQGDKMAPSDASLDAVAGTDVGDDQEDDREDGTAQDPNDNASANMAPALETISSEAERMEISSGGGGGSGAVHSLRSKNDFYFSDDSTVATPQPR
ncbi:hypothetical protein HJC23_000762 [Cyclotella cryptica]|uniref:Uncharacterized protein n=1 Tax=Cyclotella cryptica TaxID=29204 RepID=A0ABD3PZ36_9STRA